MMRFLLGKTGNDKGGHDITLQQVDMENNPVDEVVVIAAGYVQRGIVLELHPEGKVELIHEP